MSRRERPSAALPAEGRFESGGSCPTEPRPSEPVAAAPRDRRVRVLHVISTLLPGGTEMAMLHLIKHMDPAAYSFGVAYLWGDASIGSLLQPHLESPPFRVGIRAKVDPVALLRLRAYVRRQGIDLVHTHMELADYYGAFAARFGGARALVSSKHNADEFRVRRTWKRYPFLLLERLAYEAADSVLVVSRGLRDFLHSREYLPCAKMTVVENGVDPGIAGEAPPSREARLTLGLTAFSPLLGTVGRLASQKGHTFLLRAMPAIIATHPRAGLVIAGEGPQRAELEAEAASLGIADRTVFLGHRSDVPTILAALDLFVLPSLWEGLSKALLEAMALALPVVAARAVGVADVIEDGSEGLLVPPADSEALADAVARVLADRDLALRLGAAGRRRVIERYSMSMVADRVDEVYRQILERKG